MSNILFLTAQYTGAASANGICTKNVVKELTKKGHAVTVLGYENGVSEENVYTIPVYYANTKNCKISKIGKTVGSFFLPVLDKNREQNFTKMTLSLCEEKEIDAVVCIFFPLETVSVMKCVKEAFPHIKTIVYELDSIGDGIFASSKFHYLATLAYEKWSGNNYCYADKIIIMKSHKKYWNRVWGKRYGNKLLIADIPVLIERTLPYVEKTSDSPTLFLYGGLLGKKYRSPGYLLSVVDSYSKKERVSMDFYTKGDCEQQISTFRETNPCVHQHGYVPEVVLEEAIARADILVSIGNRVSRSVPSKLITYLSYGKPVVHFASQREDVCIQYLEQYPLGLTLCEWDSVEENTNKLYDFVKRTRGNTVEFSKVEDTLLMNSPRYSADLIIENL